jgi:hypothetical protein
MLSRFRKLPSPATVISFVALLAVLGTGSAVALTGSNNVGGDDLKANSVGASEIRSNSIHRSEMFHNAVASAEVANNSLTGTDINEGTLNLNGGGGGGGLTPFTATLGSNQSKVQAIGNFTVTASTNAAGVCQPITLAAGNLDSQRAIGLGVGFVNLGANNTVNVVAANVSQAFTAVTDDGSSTMSGVVGRTQQGANCLITGYLTGN